MNDINKMPPVCAYCPYWEVCKPPYICASIEDKKPDLQPTCKQVAADTISRQALCEYALNQKDKNITANDIMRFPSAQPKSYREGYQAGYKDAQSETAERTAETAQNVSDGDLKGNHLDAPAGAVQGDERMSKKDIPIITQIDQKDGRISRICEICGGVTDSMDRHICGYCSRALALIIRDWEVAKR